MSPPASASASPRRLRRTVVFQCATYERQLAAAEAAERDRWNAGRRILLRGRRFAACDCRGVDLRGSDGRSFLREHLQALLKAFVDAARPAGGLPVAADGWPIELETLLAAGRAHSAAGVVGSRFDRNARAGAAVDVRLAEAALSFFQFVLEQPLLQLSDIGAVDSERARSSRRLEEVIRRAGADLDGAVVEALLRRSDETATYCWLFDHCETEYRDLRLVDDADGTRRIRLERVTRYGTLRLVAFTCRHRPTMTFEWYEGGRFLDARLRVRRVGVDGAVVEAELPLRRRLDAERGVLVVEPALEGRPELQALLLSPASDDPRRQVRHLFEWTQVMLLNASDRDIIVSYVPVHEPEVVFDASACGDFEVVVGDSPGLVRTGRGWRLARTLPPREVLAVRIRSRAVGPAEALSLSPSGEWRPSAPPDRSAKIAR